MCIRDRLDREEAALFERLGGVVESALGYPNPIEALSQLLFEIAPFGVDNHLLRSELSLLAVRDPELAASYLSLIHISTTHQYYGRTWYVWNNTGDSAYLRNAAGTLVHSCTWSALGVGAKSC